MTALLQTFGFSIAVLLATLVNYTYYILFGAILLSIVISYLTMFMPANSFILALYNIVGAIANPILAPIRSRIPPLKLGGFGLDLSPIVAIILLSVAQTLLLLLIENFVRPVTG